MRQAANILILIILGIFFNYLLNKYQTNRTLPLVAIANYGPHSSLTDTIEGIKVELNEMGFTDNKDIVIQVSDLNFISSLIPQMITKILSSEPTVIVALGTPIALYTKNKVKEIPIVFSAITDPVVAGLLPDSAHPGKNITGAADRQDFTAILNFAKNLIPNCNRVGVLYSTSEINDKAMLKMLQDAATASNMKLVSIPIAQQRDITQSIQAFHDKVDFIYVGTSGAIQPALPIIAIEATKMNIPIINSDQEAVKEGMVLASFGVNYFEIGKNTGKIVGEILKGKKVDTIAPVYPTAAEHVGYISKKQADKFGIKIPDILSNIKIEK